MASSARGSGSVPGATMTLSSGTHPTRAPPPVGSTNTSGDAVPTRKDKKGDGNNNKKKAKKAASSSEKVPLIGKVKQARKAHKMTKGLSWRQRWKLFKCYRKIRKMCCCC